MSVSKPLENSAIAFCNKYACNFDFEIFESRVEEFTFLRPNSGWVDLYKTIFDWLYKRALEKVSIGVIADLDAEAMLDDFEYTLIRPYVNESKEEIKHKPYVGMDRIARLDYLDKLTREAPSNPVDLYTQKYKNGELSIKQMKSTLAEKILLRDRYVEIAGYVQALENVNRSRSALWRTFHPFKNCAEKRDSALMKQTFMSSVENGDEDYDTLARAAYERFEGHERVNASILRNRECAMEERDRMQKMNDAMMESLHAEDGGEQRKRSGEGRESL